MDNNHKVFDSSKLRIIKQQTADEYTAVVLQPRKITAPTDTIYDTPSVAVAIDNFNKNEINFGQLGYPESDSASQDLSKVSHQITKLQLNDSDEVIADIKILNTPYGKMVQDLLTNDIGRFGVRMLGQYNEQDNKFKDIQILSIDLVSH